MTIKSGKNDRIRLTWLQLTISSCRNGKKAACRLDNIYDI